VLRAAMNPDEIPAEVVTQVYVPKVIETKYPDLTPTGGRGGSPARRRQRSFQGEQQRRPAGAEQQSHQAGGRQELLLARKVEDLKRKVLEPADIMGKSDAWTKARRFGGLAQARAAPGTPIWPGPLRCGLYGLRKASRRLRRRRALPTAPVKRHLIRLATRDYCGLRGEGSIPVPLPPPDWPAHTPPDLLSDYPAPI
jgi:hypothetical protein